jgi:hypothetical protein
MKAAETLVEDAAFREILRKAQNLLLIARELQKDFLAADERLSYAKIQFKIDTKNLDRGDLETVDEWFASQKYWMDAVEDRAVAGDKMKLAEDAYMKAQVSAMEYLIHYLPHPQAVEMDEDAVRLRLNAP